MRDVYLRRQCRLDRGRPGTDRSGEIRHQDVSLQALYFVDREGVIRDRHFGEGQQSERVLQELLDVEREPDSVEGVGVEAEAGWDDLETPETYLGYGRGNHFASPDGSDFVWGPPRPRDSRRRAELAPLLFSATIYQ